tara:strand:- start:107288 stop:108118 length:831 start_codon:yes stop_codon:yes gene_type:complete
VSFSLPTDASAEGWRIDQILHATHWAVVLLSIITLVWLAISLVRDRKHRKATFTHGTSRREKAVPLALAAFVFFCVDGYLLIRSHTDLNESILRANDMLEEEDVIRVQIGARQWAWDIRYPGADDEFGTSDDFFAVSEIVIPVGRPIVFELGSSDVIHALYLPNFRIKQDAVPGRVLRGWFEAKTLGSYDIACAQHCGVHHYQMGGTLKVLSDVEYTRWASAMSLDGLRMHAEDARAQSEEAGYQLRIEGDWPEAAPSRDWAWPWGRSVQHKGEAL